jgi:hypothetical protein
MFVFFAYFSKMKVTIKSPVCLSVSVSPINNLLADRWIFTKFGRQVIPLKMTSVTQFQSRSFRLSKMGDV